MNSRRCRIDSCWWLRCILIGQATLLTASAWIHSPNDNEPAHLAAGLRIWHTGEFDLYRVNPPLVRIIAALPVAILGYEMDWPEVRATPTARPEFEIGAQLVAANGPSFRWLLFLSRLAVMPFALLGTWICYLWSRQLFGPESGLAAAALHALNPMVIGHGAMISPDLHAASLGMAACYGFWLWLREATVAKAVWTGVVLGLSETAKYTMLLLFPVWPVIWICDRFWSVPRPPIRRFMAEAAMMSLRLAVALYVINAIYLFGGTMRPLGQFPLASNLFRSTSTDAPNNPFEVPSTNRFTGGPLNDVPIPLPYHYVAGIDTQQIDFESFPIPGYLDGQFSHSGWYRYYLFAFSYKTPIGTIAIVILATAIWLYERPISFRSSMVLWLPPLIIFLVVSTKSGINHHLRYLLPCYPFLFVWCSVLWRSGQEPTTSLRGNQRSIVRTLSTWLLIISAFSTLYCFPNGVGYFNLLIGPSRGCQHLLGSNCDWGQDLYRVQRWASQSATPHKVFLLSDCQYDPLDLLESSIERWYPSIDQPAETISSGHYVLSVNHLFAPSRPQSSVVNRTTGIIHRLDHRWLTELSRMTPTHVIGASYRVFSDTQVKQARRRSEAAK